jgi:DNA-binding FadR family transcriptional regulator
LSTRISDLLDRGEFGVDGRLPSELALADRFGVSRPVVREALSRLRSRGVIVSRKGSGSYIRKSPEPASSLIDAPGFWPIDSLAAVRKCFEFRTGVEGEAAFFAAQNHAPETLEAIRAALARLEAVATNGVVGMKADLDFHLAVARASGNEYFEAVMQSMRTPIEFAINLARSLTLTRPLEHLRTVQTEHVVLFQAIEARDKDAARAAMRRHIENTCRRVFEGPGSGGMRVAEPEGIGRV